MILKLGVLILLIVFIGFLLTKIRYRELKPFNREITDPLRGILALLIVFHHLSLQIPIPIVGSVGQHLGSPIVALFFLLSGYGLGFSFLSKGSLYLKGFFKKRFSKLLPVFLFLTFIAVIIDIVSGDSLVNQIQRLILEGNPPLLFSWFIYAIIFTYFSFYLSAFFGKTPKKTGLYFIAFNVIYIILTSSVGEYGYFWYTTIPAVNLGYYIAINESSITKFMRQHTLAVYASAIIIIIVSFWGVNQLRALMNIPSAFCNGFLTLVISASGYLLIRLLGFIRWKPLVWIGAFSMEIYLVHGFPIRYLKPLRNLPIFEGIGDILYVFLVYSLSILAAWVLHKISSKIANTYAIKSQAKKN